MVGMPRRRIDRLLEIMAGMNMAKEKLRDPLVLGVATRRAPGRVRFAVTQGEGRCQRGSRRLPGRERGRMAFIEPEHLRTSAEAEAKLGNHRRGLQPAAGRS